MSKVVKVGSVFAPKDKRRDSTRIRVDRVEVRAKRKYAVCATRRVGQRNWIGLTHIRLDRLLSRAYRLVSK